MTRIVDVGPTLLGLVGATVRGLDGRDVRSDWEQPSSTEDLVLFYDKAARCGAAVRGRYKYVLNGGCLYADAQHVGWPDDDDDDGRRSTLRRPRRRVPLRSGQRPGRARGRRKQPSCRPRRAPRVALRRGDRLGAVARARDARRSRAPTRDSMAGGG